MYLKKKGNFSSSFRSLIVKCTIAVYCEEQKLLFASFRSIKFHQMYPVENIWRVKFISLCL